MEIWLNDGRMEIDNNLVENAIRPTAIGKKNWLFFGDARAGQRSAILYTIIENCRREAIDPYAYLRDVLTRLPKMTNQQIPQVTPEPGPWPRKDRFPSPLPPKSITVIAANYNGYDNLPTEAVQLLSITHKFFREICRNDCTS